MCAEQWHATNQAHILSTDDAGHGKCSCAARSCCSWVADANGTSRGGHQAPGGRPRLTTPAACVLGINPCWGGHTAHTTPSQNNLVPCGAPCGVQVLVGCCHSSCGRLNAGTGLWLQLCGGGRSSCVGNVPVEWLSFAGQVHLAMTSRARQLYGLATLAANGPSEGCHNASVL